MNCKQKIFFRADADKQIGYGHFVRSLALADMIKEDFDCIFFTQSPTEYQKREIQKVCPLIELPSNDTKLVVFLNFLQGDEIVFLDNYFFTSDYQLQIKNRGCKLICLGTNERHYYADVLLNFAESDASIFSVEPYTKIKLGIDWVILRTPFRNFVPQRESIVKQDIVICFGGTDQFGLTERCVEVLQCWDIKRKIYLIATDSFGLQRVKDLQAKGVVCHLNATAEKIVEIFSVSTCILSSASTITQEALACGVVCICGYYVDNQQKMYSYLSENKLVIGVDNWLDPDMGLRLRNVLMNLENCKKNLRERSFKNLQNNYISLLQSL